MKIVALEPFAIDTLARFGEGRWELVGVSHLEPPLADNPAVAIVTQPGGLAFRQADTEAQRLAQGLTRYPLDLERLIKVSPDLVLSSITAEDPKAFVSWAQDYLTKRVGHQVSLRDVSVGSLAAVYQIIEDLGGVVGAGDEARRLAGKIKGQLMLWADSFFHRCRGKRVAVLSNLDPITVATQWFPDLIQMFGGKVIEGLDGSISKVYTWQDIVTARVDVLIVAPEYSDLSASLKTLSSLQKLKGWEDLPAVKRGEVIFSSGTELYRPGPRFLKGTAVLVSAMAGLDSGYITDRDEFFKVRYLELHRHRFL